MITHKSGWVEVFPVLCHQKERYCVVSIHHWLSCSQGMPVIGTVYTECNKRKREREGERGYMAGGHRTEGVITALCTNKEGLGSWL